MDGIDFGPVILGGNVFGWTVDRDRGFQVLDAFFEGGGRAIDTADVYPAWVPGNVGGESETIVGAWIESRGVRDDVVLMTKLGSLEGRTGLAAATVARAAAESLDRLRTDRVDVLFAHRDDPSVPQEESLGALDALVREGRAVRIGASNFTADRLRSAAAIAARDGLTPFTVSQDRWSLVERGIEVELVPALEDLGVVETPYSSLASGFLSGKYRPGGTVDSARAERATVYLDDPRDVDLLSVLDDVAADHGVHVPAIALAWLAAQRTVGAPIASARTPEQVAELLASAAVRLTPQDLEQLSATTEAVGG